MKQQLGFLMQIVALGFLPAIILYAETVGFETTQMPMCLLAGVAVFMVGTKLRGA